MKILIDPFLSEDIENIKHLQPSAWGDITEVFRKFTGKEYFYAVKVMDNNFIAGIGEVIYHSLTAWIGNIVVDANYRNRGIGLFITKHLLDLCDLKRLQSISLLATDMAVPLYTKLGFKTIGYYRFYRHDGNFNAMLNIDEQRLSPIKFEDLREIESLDIEAYGEQRIKLLSDFYESGFVFKSRSDNPTLKAFYIPTLGDGLIVANEVQAGIETMKYHVMRGAKCFSIPEENTIAINFVRSLGYNYYRKATLMTRGKTIDRNPKMIFSRIGGYLG